MNEEQKIRIYAHEYWDLDQLPPNEYISAVITYIRDHPEEFKGVVPM